MVLSWIKVFLLLTVVYSFTDLVVQCFSIEINDIDKFISTLSRIRVGYSTWKVCGRLEISSAVVL